MNSDATTIALKHVIETKQLIERLVTSSESFDYLAAKAALKELQKKARELNRVQQDLGQLLPEPASGQIVPFPSTR